MARQRPADRQAQLEAYLVDFHGYIAQGMTYARARARFLRDHPEVSANATATLGYLEREVRQANMAQGNARRAERRRYNREQQDLANQFQQQDLVVPEVIRYDPVYALGVEPSRIEIQWSDPQTRVNRHTVIYAPIIAGSSIYTIASMAAGLMEEHEGPSGGSRIQAVYLALLESIRTGGLSINGEVRRQ